MKSPALTTVSLTFNPARRRSQQQQLQMQQQQQHQAAQQQQQQQQAQAQQQRAGQAGLKGGPLDPSSGMGVAAEDDASGMPLALHCAWGNHSDSVPSRILAGQYRYNTLYTYLYRSKRGRPALSSKWQG